MRDRPGYYILEGKTPVPADVVTWGFWFDDYERRIVAQTEVYPHVRISTVFIGIDVAFSGPPCLFETMVFHEDDDHDFRRQYSTWEEAEAGHEEIAVRLLSPLN